jgi:hypothetical protein
MKFSRLSLISVIIVAAYAPLNSLGSDNTTTTTSDPFLNQAMKDAETALGEAPLAFEAGVDLGFTPGTQSGVIVRWAVGRNGVIINDVDSGKRVHSLKPEKLIPIERKLHEPTVMKQLKDLASRSYVFPDAGYYILFVHLEKEPLVLEFSDIGANAAQESDPQYRAMLQCWDRLTGIFKPLLNADSRVETRPSQ